MVSNSEVAERMGIASRVLAYFRERSAPNRKGYTIDYPDSAIEETQQAKTLSLEDVRRLNPEALRVVFWVMDSLRFSIPGKEVVGFNFAYNGQGLREVKLEYLEKSSRVS